jgi:hypothetical protein
MNIFFQILRSRCFAMCVLLVLAQDCPAEPIDQLIDGLLARAQLIVSGEIQYQFEESDTTTDHPNLPPPVTIHLAIRDHDWVLRYDGSPNFQMQRDNTNMKYYAAAAPSTGVTDHTLHIEGAESLNGLVFTHPSYAGFRLGTFWFPEQTQFIARARSRTRQVGASQVEGVPTVQLAWDVAAEDLDEAMLIIPREIAKARQGILRVDVAPSLGYALPRIAYCDPEGKAIITFESRDFQRDGDEIFLPRSVTCTTIFPQGEQTSRFTVNHVRNLNRPLTDEVFRLDIPKDTYIRDSRPGAPVSIFRLSDQDQLQALDHSLRNQDNSRTWGGRRLAMLSLNLGVLFVLGVAWTIQWRRRAQS